MNMTPTTTTTFAALGAEIRLPTVWIVWMLCICALNGAAALACVAFVLHKTPDCDVAAATVTTTTFSATASTPTPATTRMARQNAIVIEEDRVAAGRVCGKRKTREHQPEFPLARKQHAAPREDEEDITQGRCKLRRVTKITTVRFGARRSRSFGDELPTPSPLSSPPSPLRRVVSCGDSAAIARPFAFKTKTEVMSTSSTVCAPLEEASATVSDLLREIRLHDVLSSAKTAVVAKLREAARNAVDEVLTSIISFLTYGMLLFILRQYSAVAVGVSLDLGAFSIEL